MDDDADADASVRDDWDARGVRDVRDEFRTRIGVARRTRVAGVATVRERAKEIRGVASCRLDVRERGVGVRDRGGVKRRE